jgi:Tol biopolymer transport system component
MGQHRSLSGLVTALLVCLLAACGGSSKPRPDLVLVSTRDGDYAIYALNADGGNQRRLSSQPEPDLTSPRDLYFQVQPAWSPTGSQIAFASGRSGSFDIYVMSADGSSTRRLSSTSAHEGNPTWSPDGEQIAFERGRPGDLFVMNVDGSATRRLGRDSADEADPAWSPDGRWIVYVRRTPGTSARELWLVRPDRTGRHALTSYSSATLSPCWSPDSKRIVFAAAINTTKYDIYTIGVDGKGMKRLTRASEDAFEPAWSPDGKTIAFSRGGSIVTVDLAGEATKITDPEGNDSSPAWKPRTTR